MLSNCKVCGVEFEARRRTAKTRKPGGMNQWVCSPECSKKKAEETLIRRTICVVCGGKKESVYGLTCSDACKRTRKVQMAKGKSMNLCFYTAPDEWDYANMLDILHRKGYVKASDTKEKWTYCTEGYPKIQWVDRVASGVVVPRETRTSKEQQGHAHGVQQEAQAPGASAHPVQELCPRN